MSSLPGSPTRPVAASALPLPRSPLEPVTNVSQSFAELERVGQAREDSEEIFSQDDQLQDSSTPAAAPSPSPTKAADAKSTSTSSTAKAKRGKTKAMSVESSSSKDAIKHIDLGVSIALAAASTDAKGKAVKVTTKDGMTRCPKETTYADFKTKIVAAAINAGLNVSNFDNLDIEGKIPAGGIWKDKKRLHDQDAFRSLWDKILKKKAWEAYIFVSPSANAAIEISSDSDIDADPVKLEPESTDELHPEPKKKRKSDEGSGTVDAATSNKRAKVAVKDEAEEARKKVAEDILRRHACSKHGSKACFVLRGGVHLAVDNEILDRWIAAIERDPAANTSSHLPNDKHIDRKTKEAFAKYGLRSSPIRRDRSTSPASHMLQSDYDEELPNVLSSSEMSRFRRRSRGSTSIASSSSSRLPSVAQPRASGPGMTFGALAKHVKLDDAIVTKLVKVGVTKASAFARMTEEKLKQVGYLEGEVEEALDAQDRWRRIDPKSVKKEELVDALHT
ncbi:hypothetical protein CF328_g8575 [Tilletia controversa]|nr:hypothetical protein CF328_g8575 [Tilletia controversa]